MMSSHIDCYSDVTLLLTASINPNGMDVSQSLADPNVRMRDYIDTLRYYLIHHASIHRVVFVDNSGWPLSALEAAAAEFPNAKLEFHSFSQNDFPLAFGKSHGELKMIESVMDVSPLLRNARCIIKMTGRNKLLNLTQIIAATREPVSLMADLRDHPLYDWLRLNCSGHHADTRMLLFTRETFDREFRGKYHELNEQAGRFIEDLVFDIIKRRISSGDKAVKGRFPLEPIFAGVAGHWDKRFDSPRERLKRTARGCARRIAPWLWI